MLLLPKIETLSISNRLFKKTITTISVLSYSLYLLNRTPIYQNIFFPFRKYTDNSLILAAISYVSFYLLCGMAAYLFYRWVEKPLTDLRERF